MCPTNAQLVWLRTVRAAKGSMSEETIAQLLVGSLLLWRYAPDMVISNRFAHDPGRGEPFSSDLGLAATSVMKNRLPRLLPPTENRASMSTR